MAEFSSREKPTGLCPECSDELYADTPHACWGSSPANKRDKRFQLARDILLKLMECADKRYSDEAFAKNAVDLADALIAELDKPQ